VAKFTYLFELPSYSYSENVIAISRNIFLHTHMTCYVTLNKTSGIVKNTLRDGGIFTSSYVFIDGISSALFQTTTNNETTYLHYPLRLEELEKAIWKKIDQEGVDSIIFDSLSTLTMYPDQQEVLRFFHRLIAKLAERRIVTAFLCLLEDSHKDLIAHVAMSVDEVQEVRGK